MAREPVVLIIGLAGQAPSRRLRLSSNVEPMTNLVECPIHGKQQETFVCCHLVAALRTGKRVGFFWSGQTRGDAWCSECEQSRISFGGESGDWNEQSEAVAKIQVLCGACYDRVREQHGL
ncbi:conserved hypothetical protein [uncultured Defluviicoccus sp.]|uniref:Uncharacterized protein n=1 Tax=metagenome TaxID=256318 RepID=A0A380TBQ8_9ZZZZ|nr:conserved hypothetical protein [uncultured Defluviicoccus sp.]